MTCKFVLDTTKEYTEVPNIKQNKKARGGQFKLKGR